MSQWRALTFTLLLCVVTTALSWLSLESYDHQRIHQRIQNDAKSLEANVRASLIQLMYAAELSGTLLKGENLPSPNQSQVMYSIQGFYDAITTAYLIDTQFNILESYGSPTPATTTHLHYLLPESERLRLLQVMDKPVFANPTNLSTNKEDLAIITPVVGMNQRHYLVLIVNMTELYATTIHHHIQEGYQVTIERDNEEIFRFAGNDDFKAEWEKEFVVRTADISWHFDIWPTVDKHNQIHVIQPSYPILIGVLLTSVFLGLVFIIKQRDKTIAKLQIMHQNTMYELDNRLELESQLTFLSEHDGLTELPNRNAVLRYLNELPTDLIETTVAIQLNLDHFKDINTTLGHKLGDELLRRVAHRLQRGTSNFSFLARLGGDEFIIIKHGINTTEQALEIANNIRQILRPQFFINHHEIYSSVSIGIAFSVAADFDAERLLRQADIALNQAKTAGYHGLKVYSEHQQLELTQRLEVLEQLHEAIDKQRLEVHYQPIFDMRSHRITGVEGLVRWRQSNNALMLPASFLPLIENTGLIIPLTEALIRDVLQQAKKWQEQGFNDLSISLNFSGKQLAMPELPRIIGEQLRRANIPAERLHIEIEKHLYCKLANTAIEVLQALKAVDVRLTVDGFGLTQLSLEALRRCPPHHVKIGRALINRLPYDTEQSLVVETIIKFAHESGIEVSAVGVETQQQVDFLIQRDCLSAQGFYLSPALPAEQLLNRLTMHNTKQPKTIIGPL